MVHTPDKRDAVWAVSGSFDKLNAQRIQVPFVEFYTVERPTAVEPAAVQFRNGIDILITKSIVPGEKAVEYAPF